MHVSLVVVAAALLLGGCDRGYEIEGTVVVARGAGTSVVPAVVCEGKGGPLGSSAIYGHPADRTLESSKATILCKPAAADMTFLLRESITQGPLPRRAHVYAWLEPVPAAAKLCVDQGTDVLEVDRQMLDQLMEPDEAKKSPGERGLDTYPCGRNPVAGRAMTYAVTFDPDHKTWTEGRVGLFEHRDLRIEK